MTSNVLRANTLVHALQAGIEGDHDTLEGVLTDDVRAWTPTVSAHSLTELLAQLDHRNEAFSDPELVVTPLDVGGDLACAEWSVALTHTGTLRLNDETKIAPTGIRVTVHGITVAEFHGEHICAFRQYWDASSVLEQLGLTPAR